ncbi:MAG: hypothetical protein QW666_04435 [Candidatus Woesearchaeota archaeon]
MKGIAQTNKGIEDISTLEIKEIINSDSQAKEGFVIFEFNDFKDLFKLSYSAQSLSRVLYLLGKFNKNKLEEISNLDLKEWLEGKTFAVACEQAELRAEIGKHIPGKVNLSKPDITFFAILDKDDMYLCIDFSGDISKRQYRIFMGSETLKSGNAYALLRIAGYDAKKKLIDPFCRAGTIAIEAALYACRLSPNFFNKHDFPFVHFIKFSNIDFEKFFITIDKQSNLDRETGIFAIDRTFNNVQAAKKNAKIAGIIKKIDFSKTELEDLELKFNENSIDLVITEPIQPSKAIPDKIIDKIYKELFYQADFILKEKGAVALIVKSGVEQLKKWASEYKFKCVSERKIMQGKETWIILKIERVSS